MRVAGTPGQAPEIPAGQAPNTDAGQAPEAGSDAAEPKTDRDKELAEARREAAAYRKQLREVQSKNEQTASEKTRQAEAEALKRGEHEKVILARDAKVAELEADLKRERTERILHTKLAEHRPRPEALANILKVFPSEGLDLTDEKAVSAKFVEFKAANPYFFQDAAAGASGLPGSRPVNGGTAATVTPADEKWAKDHSVSPEAAARIREKRAARSAQA